MGAGGGYERVQKIIYPTFTKAFRYDEEGRVSEEIYTFNGGESSSVTYAYDRFGRLASTTSPDGKLKKDIRPMGQETVYSYDDLGRVWKILDAKHQTTQYEYDNQSRLWKIHYAGRKTVTLSYDGDGNLAGYDDGVTSASYTYNALGQKLTETVNFGPFSKSFSYSYYKNGLKHTFTAPDNTMYTYMYGLNNEFKDVQIPGVGSITIPEYTWNRPKTITFPGGTQRTAIYDALMRIQSLSVTDPGGNPLLNYQYTYDSVGNIQIKTTEHGMYAYGYDSSNRLTNVDNPVLPDETYTYDNVGNRTTASNATGTIEHNQNNELRIYGDLHYDYDANGNLIEITLDTQRIFLYVYNTENRLVKVENGVGGMIAEYDYDPFGRRLWKDVGGERTYFFYSDEGLIAEYDASGHEIKSYGYQPDSTWTTDPLWLKQHGQYYFYQNDHLGTPQKLVAQNGAVVWSASYAAFGQAYMEVETVVNNLRFPGQYFDAETGLHHNFHRYYDPGSGRYVRKDPKGFLSRDVHLYRYAKNNPLTLFDPKGLTSRTDIDEDTLDYSCNCGWIDWNHASRWAIDGPDRGPLWDGTLYRTAIGISLDQGWERSKTGKGYRIQYYQGGYAGGNIWFGGNYFVKDGLSEPEKLSVAFAIFKEVSLFHEISQGWLPWPPTWPEGLFWHPSSFSEEDLVSNQLAFYMAVFRLNKDAIIRRCGGVLPNWAAHSLWREIYGPDAKTLSRKSTSWRPTNYNSHWPASCFCSPEMRWPFEKVEPQPAPKGELWRDWYLGIDTETVPFDPEP